jgi:NAD(P)H-dependent flavin oxidoreductase YrpB (nitropropane dioxygenase family)
MSLAFERLARERPIVQAGMGGGVARHELAAAVSEAGGLGTLGILAPARLRAELEAARRLTGAPLAVNLLLPFAGREHWEIAETADVVVTFWGKPQRRTSRLWLHACGSVEEACAAEEAGADGVVAQGIEAGGHVRGTLPALDLLDRVRSALPELPALVAGGMAEAHDVREALAAGAVGAVLGTRFLLSDESRAHPRYKEAALAAEETVLTELFGLGWPAPHRVVPNAATRRWLAADDRGPRWARAAQRRLSPLAARLPDGAAGRLAAAQRPALPLFSPSPPVDDAPLGRLLAAGALYAGESVARIGELRPAAELVSELTP